MALPEGFEEVTTILSPATLPYRVEQQLKETYPDAEIVILTQSPEFVLNNRDWKEHRNALSEGVDDNCTYQAHYHLLTSGYSGLQLSSCMAAIMLAQANIQFSLMQWNPMHRRYFIVPYAGGRPQEPHLEETWA
jgi:hypothetical protein